LCALAVLYKLFPDAKEYRNGICSPPPEEGAAGSGMGEALEVKQKKINTR